LISGDARTPAQKAALKADDILASGKFKIQKNSAGQQFA
jgi:hypothetical protein